MRILIAVAALSMAFAGTAYAQNRPSDHRPGQQQTHQPNRQPPRPIARPAPVRYKAPSHWRGSNTNWQRHVAQCQRKYRSYNPRTDRYTVRAGRTAICRL